MDHLLCNNLLISKQFGFIKQLGQGLNILVMWIDVGFWIQKLTVRTPASACCVPEQDNASALLKSTKLRTEYQVGTTS